MVTRDGSAPGDFPGLHPIYPAYGGNLETRRGWVPFGFAENPLRLVGELAEQSPSYGSKQWNLRAPRGQVSGMNACAEEGPSDAELITRSRTEPRYFAPLFERHAVAVHRYLAAKSNSTDVEDQVSETFLTAFSSRDHFDSSHSSALHGSSA